MEVVENAADLVANLGFPIFFAVLMFREMERERAAHKEESDKWVEALNRNTVVMEKILTLLGENA